MSKKKPLKRASVLKSKTCRCFERINKKLEEHNTQLDSRLVIDWASGGAYVLPVISTSRIDKRKREAAKTVVPLFCPFCGKAYPE